MDIGIIRATSADADTIVRMIRELAESSGGKAAVESEYVGRYLAFPGRTILLALTAG